ncbi:MAG: dephospho-CoA kinase [Candidatus Omnitrophica bacterium]|nr:dephospho-CoA kinase [Candidatus Omnitrophota bacterium]
MGKKVLVLGVTGGLASGKTTVASMFKRLGAFCIDVDTIYHQLIKPKAALYKKIISAFGNEILGRGGRIDRKKLGKLVFSKKQNLKRLCRITHPAIIKGMGRQIRNLKRSKKRKIILIDAPLLVEVGLVKMVDRLIVVKASRKKQIARSAKVRGLCYGETIKRIGFQVPLREKIKLADFVIDNNGTLKQTRKQVKAIWEQINERQRQSVKVS